MKIRTGFVSNSSSSSFVVVFPKKPTSSEDVLKFMFDGDIREIEQYDYRMTTDAIAERVWCDLSTHKSTSRGTLANVIAKFVGRYYYDPRGNRFGGYNGWMEYPTKYFLSDKKLVAKYEELYAKNEQKDAEFKALQDQIMSNFTLKEPKPAWKDGVDWKTKKPFTYPEIKAYETYKTKLEKFYKTNTEYIAYIKAYREFTGTRWDEECKLQKLIATADAKNFVKDNKGKFIFIVSYSDNEGDTLMEHGEIFRNVPYIKVNHH